MVKRLDKIRLALLAAMFLAVLWGFQAMILNHAPDVFRAKEEDMSFGWIVPLFSLYVIWDERKAIVSSFARGSWNGFVLLLPSILLGFIGARGLQLRFEIVAFTGIMISLAWIVFGKMTAKKILFPAAFLLFCIPLATFLDVITVHLRIFVTTAASAIMQGLGVDVIRHGTMLVSAAQGGFEIDVAEPCSGLRSIFALMALTAGYAYYNQPTLLRKWILFALSIPIAVFGNIVRILTICLVANFASKDFATGFYHDYSGYVVFIAAILVMIATSEAMNRIWPKKAQNVTQESAKEREREVIEEKKVLPYSAIAAFAIIFPAMIYQATTPEVTVAEAPEVHLYEITGFESREQEISEAEKTVLPQDTKIEKRKYISRYGEIFSVSLVIGGKSKSSIHRPELCLPSQGYLMNSPHTFEVDGIDWRYIRLEGMERGNIGFAYTFFNQEGFRTSSHVRRILQDTLDRTFLNRIDRWVMITIETPWANEEAMKEFIHKMRPSLGFMDETSEKGKLGE
ncbi:MAG: exosortase [Kiritimatiellae bacterium]|nr:exosortase [Kiritimatiellia bacterium]